MTKMKVKGSYLSQPLERVRPAAEDYPVDDEDDEQDAVEGNYVPFVNADNKGKRAPRRPTHRDSSGLQSSDSAIGTSSSTGSDGDDDNISLNNSHTGDYLPLQYQAGRPTSNALSDSARRGSIRMIVKPSKFRENQLPSHPSLEGRSPLKKKHSGPPFDSTGFKQPFHNRAYASVDRISNELNTALMVVRKIMKMDAAEPFNVPVDPVALGIPDYFDIVKRPMDLGTICKNLERGGKYRSSRDVYEDVQLVWTNCRIYNQKGDPILELLGRVKKNFMKYWTAAGLYTEKSPGPIKQGMVENKPVKRHPPEYIGGFRKDQEASAIGNDELDSYYSNREGPKVISVYKTHKQKLLEQQGNEHQKAAGPKVYEDEVEQKPGGQGMVSLKHPPHADKMVKQKDVDLQGTPWKARRVSGTGHHKADCSCVVCTGVRRKLAREGKLPSHLVNPSGTAESPVAQDKILVRLKAEGINERQKFHHGSGSGQKTKERKRKEIDGGRAESALLKKTKFDDIEMASMNADLEKAIERDENGKVTIKEEGKAYSEIEGKLESITAGSEEEYKGTREEMDDREEGVQIDEQPGDIHETERLEGGVKYYRASYEMPLRKVNASILQIGKKLFGSCSPWNHGRSLSRQSSTRFSENPIHATVSRLLSSNAT
ncbi:hypothetical protein GOP47_0020500 [Adiantum capillus-veneris]|uniref:Bromo domain-containing protein n=1 Tax=Adiantum capillus-veneris TaxID=13818 RepID=A0A9D4U9H9_ADICA|nr:hypothetical protein GOP47_0020500 [Adiantum capillus-veneris]